MVAGERSGGNATALRAAALERGGWRRVLQSCSGVWPTSWICESGSLENRKQGQHRAKRKREQDAEKLES